MEATPRDVVVCTISDTFSDSVRRGFYSTADQTILSLIDSDMIRRVLVVDHPRGLGSQVRRRLRGDVPARASGKLRGVRPIMWKTAIRPDAASLRRRYSSYDKQIGLAVRRHRLHDPYLITFNLLHAAFGSPNWAAKTMFYAQDDETEMPGLAFRRDLTAQAYQMASAQVDAVAAVTDELMSRIAPAASPALRIVVPNGVDALLWTNLHRQSRIRGGRPTAVYAGTVDARLDVQVFTKLAADGFDVNVYGPVLESRVGDALQAVDGIQLRGSVARHCVAAALSSADVCLLAHVSTPLTNAMSPLKYFEYLASGTPVVATDLCGVREGAPASMANLLVKPGEDYVAAAYAALRRGPLVMSERVALVNSMSWRTRHKPIIEWCAAN